MSSSSASRGRRWFSKSKSRTRQADKLRPRFRSGMSLEPLEVRNLLTAGLNVLELDDVVRIEASSGEELQLAGAEAYDQAQLAEFFGADDGAAEPVTVQGAISIAGRTITGWFQLTESDDASHVAIVASDVSVAFGADTGIELSDADGVFVLNPDGLAGQVTSEDASEGIGIDVYGMPGLALDSAYGLSYEINTTGAAVDTTVATPFGSAELQLDESVDQLRGAADFRIAGTDGTLLRIGGSFTVTQADEALEIAGSQVTVDLYAGSIRAITLGSVEASFALDATAFALDGALTVDAFFPLPVGQPIPANTNLYVPGTGGFNVPLGPLQIEDLRPVFSNLTFGPGGFEVDLGLSAASASLGFVKSGGDASEDSIGAAAIDLTGTFALAGDVDPNTGVVSSLTAPGAFEITAANFELNVPRILNASAENLAIHYDPRATGEQELISAETLTVSVPLLKLEGEFTPSDSTPGLVITTEGFEFGNGTLTYQDSIAFGSFLTVSNPFVRLTDFSFRRSTGVSLGGFAVGADSLEISGFGDKFKATGEEIEAAISFDDDGAVEDFTFSAGSVTAEFGDYVKIAAVGIEFNPGAEGDETVLELGAGSAELNIAQANNLQIFGAAEALSFSANGKVKGPETLTVGMAFDRDSPTLAGQFQWPAFLPIQLKDVQLHWPEFDEDPQKFQIQVSAAIDANLGPVHLQGGVDSLIIDPYRLAGDQFPIVSIDGFAVSASGNLFGGEISGSLVAGIVKLDAEGNVLDSGARDFAETVFYGAIQGQFDLPELAGLELRVGFSERGLLQAYVSATGSILLDPVSGLTLSGVRGGITFNAPSRDTPDSALELATPSFKPTNQLTVEEWRERIEQAVANQVSGGSRIFQIDQGVPSIVDQLGELDATVEKGSPLEAFFEAEGYVVADDNVAGQVESLVSGQQWLVTYKGASYILELDADVINVTLAQFTVEAASLIGGLPEGTIAQAVIDAFADNNLAISATATVDVVVEENGQPQKWKIVDGAAVYFATVRGPRLAITGGGAGLDKLDENIEIEIGATLTSRYVPEDALKVDADILISSEGKVLINGRGIVGPMSVDVRMFLDLSQVDEATPQDPVRFLFLADMPIVDLNQAAPANPTLKPPAPIRIAGEMVFEFLDSDGNLMNPLFSNDAPASFRFTLLGRAEVKAFEYASLVFGGDAGIDGGFAELQLTVSNSDESTKVQLDVSGSLSIIGLIPVEDFVSAAGTLIIEKPADRPLEITGAVKIDFDANSPGLSFLANAGLKTAQADLALAFNSTTETRELVLQLPGRPEEIFVLAPASIGLQGTGTLLFDAGISSVGATLAFDGAFDLRLSIDVAPDPLGADFTRRGDGGIDLDIFLAARLDAQVRGGGETFNLLTLDGLGLVVVRDVGATLEGELLPPIIAGRLDLFVSRNQPHIFTAEGSAQMLLNTTSEEFVYVIPDGLQETLQSIQTRRQNVAPGQVVVPSLPALPHGRLTVVVPDRPPTLFEHEDEQFAAGPYFMIQLGDPDDGTPVGTPTDGDNDGLVDVSVTLLDTFKLAGDMRIMVAPHAGGGFELAANTSTSIAIPGAENLFSGSSTGFLRISQAGLVGALGVQTALNIPGINLEASRLAYFGINTTSAPATLNFQLPKLVNPVIAPRTGLIYMDASLRAGGFEMGGLFTLSAGSQAIELQIDAGMNVFSLVDVGVSGKAGIYYGPIASQRGLVLNTQLSLGAGNQFGVDNLFEIGGNLRLNLDSRPATRRFEIAIDDARVSLLKALEIEGAARIVAATDLNGVPYLRVEGAFSGRLLGIVNVSASGFFDSRGYFGLDLSGNVTLGTDAFGIQVGGRLYIERSEEVPLDFEAEVYGRIRAFGITLLGANVGVEYDGYGPGDQGSGRISAKARLKILFVSKTVGPFTIGYLRLPGVNPPLDPKLGVLNGGQLLLNVGPNAAGRKIGLLDDGEPETFEAYTIDSLGPGSVIGEKLRVSAFGHTQVFDNVTSLAGNFGDGDDQLILTPGVGLSYPALGVNISGGSGNDMLVNQSLANVVFYGNEDDDVLLSEQAADVLDGGAGNDALSSGPTGRLRGGDGDDILSYQVEIGRPIELTGGAGHDTLSIVGTAAAETFNLDGSFTTGIETLELFGRGGADTLVVDLGGLAAAGVTSVTADLGRIPGTATAGQDEFDVPLRDDGAADRIVVQGTAAADSFSIDAVSGDVRVQAGDNFRLTIQAPNRARDLLELYAGSGDDVIVLAGPQTATPTAPGQMIAIQLFGQDGDDSITTPIGGAPVNGGADIDTVTFTVDSGDETNVTLAAGSIANGRGSSSYAEFETVAVDATAAAQVTVQTTHAGTTNVILGAARSRLLSQDNAGPLNITLTGNKPLLADRSEVYLSASRGPVTVTDNQGRAQITSRANAGTVSVILGSGDSSVFLPDSIGQVNVTGVGGNNDRLTIADGLLSTIASVSLTTVDSVVFNNSQDGQARTATIDDSGVVVSGLPLNVTHSGLRSITLQTGLADDTIHATIGRTSFAIAGGGGVDSLTATLDSPLASLNPYPGYGSLVSADHTVEFVSFFQAALPTGPDATANWNYRNSRLSVSTSPSNDWTLLDAGFNAQVDLNLIGTDDTIAVDNNFTPARLNLVGGNNRVRVGGGNLDGLRSPLWIQAANAGNRLTVDDGGTAAVAFGAPRRNTAVSGTRVLTPGGTIIRFDATQFPTLDLSFGAADDAVDLRDLPAVTTLHAGAGHDLVTAGGTLHSFSVHGDSGNDTTAISSGTGSVTFDGGEHEVDGGDTLIADRSAATQPLNGSLTVADGVAAILLDGLPGLNLDSSVNTTEIVQINLGVGNDRFAFNSAGFAPQRIDLFGNAGDDSITLHAIESTMEPNSITLYGDAQFSGNGRDTVTAVIAGLPQSGQFSPVVPRVERLVIDNRSGTQAVAWSTVGQEIYGNGLSIINSEGADRIELIGGASANDTLQIAGSDPVRPLEITIVDNSVRLFEGLNVLSQNESAVASPRVDTTVRGLSGVQDVAATADGRLIFVINEPFNLAETNSFSVYRSAGPDGAPVYLRSMDLPPYVFSGGFSTADGAVGLAVRPDGRWLFVTTRLGQVHTYEVEPDGTAPNGLSVNLRSTVRPVFLDTDIHGTQVSPDGQSLVVVTDREVVTYRIDGLTTSNPDPVEAGRFHFNTDHNVVPDLRKVTFAADSMLAYVFNFKTVYVLQRQTDGSYQVFRSIESDPGLIIPNSSTIQFSDDGSLFFAHDAGSSTLYYYEVSTAPNTLPLRLLGTLSGVTAPPEYQSQTQTLVVFRDGHREFHRQNPSSGDFEPFVSVAGGQVTSLDVAQTTSGENYAVFASASSIDWHNLSPGEDPNQSQSLPLVGAGRFTKAAVATTDGPSGAARLIGVRHNPDVQINQGNWSGLTTVSATYFLIDPATGEVLDELATSSVGIGGETQVFDVQTYHGGNGLTNVFWTIERGTNINPTYTLVKVYSIINDEITLVRSLDLAWIQFTHVGPFIINPVSNRLRFSPDGQIAYINDFALSAGFGSTTRTFELNVGPDGIPTDNPSNQSFYQYSVSGESYSDYAFRDGQRYVPNGTSIVGPESVWSHGDYGFEFHPQFSQVDQVLGVESSEDNQTLYVATYGSQPGFGLQHRIQTLRPYLRADGSTGYFRVAHASVPNISEMVRHGDQLLVSSSGSLHRLDLGSPNGLAAGVSQSVFMGNSGSGGSLVVANDVVYAGHFNLGFSNSLSSVPLTAAGTLDAERQHKVNQGQVDSRSISGAHVSAVSPNGRYYYALSPQDDGLAIYDSQLQTWTTWFDVFNVAAGALDGVSAVVVSEANGVQYAIVVSPISGTLITLASDADGLTHVSFQFTDSRLLGVQSLAYSAAEQALYTMTGEEIRRWSASLDSSSIAASAAVSGSQLMSIHVGNDRLYAVSDNGAAVSAFDLNLAGPLATIGGLSAVTDLAFAGSDVYATSSEGLVYHLADRSSTVELVATFRNNASGIRGIGGASSIAVSSDGAYVFVAGRSDNTVSVFTRDVATGALRYVQTLLDGRGARGIYQPTGLTIFGDQLIVASGRARHGGRGGFAALDIAPPSDAPPIRVEVLHTGAEGLTITGGNDADAIRLVRYPDAGHTQTALAIPITINANGGNDSLVVSDTGRDTRAASESLSFLTIDAGAGEDAITISQALSRAAASSRSSVHILPGLDGDAISIQQLSHSVNLSVVANGDPGVSDIVQVRGAGIPNTSFVLVKGDTGIASQPNDALFYNGLGASISGGDATNGLIVLPGHGSVEFQALNRGLPNQQVFIVAAPQPRISSVPTIAEGQAVTLTAVDDSGLSNVTFAWDLNGDGIFDDASGASITLSWAELRAFGIDDDGAHPIAVRATTTSNPVQFGAQSFSLSADASAILTVNNTAPTISVWSTQATLGTLFTIPLQVTAEPGNDRVITWLVNWGDGSSNDIYGSNATSAAHIYAQPGDFTITVAPVDEDFVDSVTLDYYVRQTVQVRPGAGTVTLTLAEDSIPEGEGLTLTANAVGAPVRYEWDFGGNGSLEFTTTTPTLSLSWTQLSALNINDNQSYTVRVTAIYSDGATEYPATSPSAIFSVTNVAPTGNLVLSASSLSEASPAGSLTATIMGYADPSPADTAATARVDYDFNNDGSIDLADQALTAIVNVPQSLFTTGSHTVRAILRDKDGGGRELFANFLVTDVPTSLSIDTIDAINEGGTASMTVRANDPGGVAISSWRIQWGDGSVDELGGNGQAAQTFTHVFADGVSGGSRYPVAVTARTPQGYVSALGEIVVHDVAPSISLTTTSATVVEGGPEPLVVQLAVADPGADAVESFTIDWGDGNSETFSGDVTEFSHLYTTRPAGGTYAVRVTSLKNDDGNFAYPQNALTATVLNAAPQLVLDLLQIPSLGEEATPLDLSAVAVSLANASEPLTFTWQIVTPNGQTIPLSAAPGQTILAGTTVPGYEFAARSAASYVPGDDGVYTLTLTVTDDDGGSTSISREITVANRPPVIDSFQVPASGQEASAVTFSATASDPAGTADVLTYTWTVTEITSGTAIATLDGSSVSYTPPGGGAYAIQLRVTDGDGGEATAASLLTVAAVAPTLTPGTLDVPTSAIEGDTVTFSVSATDVGDGADALQYTWTLITPGGQVSFLQGSSVSWTFADQGNYRVFVTVADSQGARVTSSQQTIQVANAAPTVQTLLVPSSGMEGQPLQFSATATDRGPRDTIGYRWSITSPTGAVITLGGSSTQFTPADEGQYVVSLTVFDDDGGETTVAGGAIEVSNLSPTLGAIQGPVGIVNEGEMVSLSVTASDVPGDMGRLVYTWQITPPQGAAFELTGSSVQFSAGESGQYGVSVTVSDGDGGSDATATSLSVENVAPVLGAIRVPTDGFAGFPSSLSAAATDTVGDAATLEYRWSITEPQGSMILVFGASSSYAPPTAGFYSVVLTVVDRDGGQVTSNAYSLNVAATTIDITSLSVPAAGAEGSPVQLAVQAHDVLNGSAVTYAWTIASPNNTSTVLTGANVQFTPADEGLYTVTLTASSINGLAQTTRTIEITNIAPTLISTSIPREVLSHTPLNLSAQAFDPADSLTYSWQIIAPGGQVTTLEGPSVSLQPTVLGLYGVQLTVSDGDGGAAVTSKLVAVVNTPPVAHAGPRVYVAPEFGTISLDASASSDVEQSSQTLSYLWDFDNDGVFGETGTLYGDEVGMQPAFQARSDGPSLLPVTLRVVDQSGAMSEDRVVVQVDNVAPVITTLSSTAATAETRSTDRRVTVSGKFSDVGLPDTHTVWVNWGDGSPLQSIPVNQLTDTFTGQHQYATGGRYTILVSARDDDGGVSLHRQTSAFVQGIGLVDGVLYVIGTNGKDHVQVKEKNNGATIEVQLKLNNGPTNKTTYAASAVTDIVMMLLGGDDHAQIHDKVRKDAILLGGDGDDHLQGGGGNNVLSGGDGDDHLQGGDLADILIGGCGRDHLQGKNGNDLLIGGLSTNENDLAALDAALADWTCGNPLGAILDLLWIIDDWEKDQLNGDSGLDLILPGLGDQLSN